MWKGILDIFREIRKEREEVIPEQGAENVLFQEKQKFWGQFICSDYNLYRS